MKPLIRQFSGGLTSAFMCAFLDKHFPDREQITLFQNTGKEDEKTLEFVHRCDLEFDWRIVWLEAAVHPDERKATTHKVVDFESASRTGEPFEKVIAKYGLPNIAYPHCTRELKQNVSRSYIKELGLTDYDIAIGIRADEAHRVNRQTAAENNWIYPLIDIYPVTRRMVEMFWQQQPFTLDLKNYEGNCDLCFKKSIQKLVSISREQPSKLIWWKRMEKRYSKINAPLEPRRMFRGHRSTDDLLALADEPTLFDNPEFEVETDCFCKSS
jgi:3'-phosphoadenosine 5'-phosphosulfate sulfotransferase (PAPS reductase)/FAD synthetase